MATGAVVSQLPIWGDHAPVDGSQLYNPGIDLEDADSFARYPVLVKDSQIWITNNIGASAKGKGGFETTFNQLQTSSGNKRARSFYDAFYERIHYDPALMNLGQLLNAQTRELHIWNGYFETRVLSSITPLDAEGLDLTHDPVPTLYRPLQERTLQLAVSVEGPPEINASYTFVWDNQTNVYRVTGQRIVVFSIAPDPQSDFTERLTWYSTVQTAYSGKEQRMALTDDPRVSYTYRVQALDNERQRLEALVWGWQSRAFAVPVWNSYTHTSQPVAPGNEIIYVDATADREFAPGKLAIILAGPALFEAVEILEVFPDRLRIKKPAQRAWTRRVPVLPARTMRMANEVQYNGQVANYREYDVTFTADATEVLQDYAWPWMYKNLPVLEFSPDMTPGLNGSQSRNMIFQDGEHSLPLIVDRSGVGTPHQTWSFVFTSLAEVQRFKSLLAKLRGICGEFWMSTWSPDMTLAAAIDINASGFYVEEALHSAMYYDRRGRKNLVIQLRDGTTYYREILSVTNSHAAIPGTELVVVDEPIPRVVTPNQVRCISFLTQSRFENESFEFVWATQDWSSMNAMIKGQTDGI